MGKKNDTVEIIKGTVQNQTESLKASRNLSTDDICNAIKDVEDKNKNIRKKITDCCNEIKQEIQKLD